MLEVMAEGFSECSPECLQVALAKSDWDMDRASAAVSHALAKACDPDHNWKACRHLVLGGCLRKDCAFNHDFATTTCRYWLQGLCCHGGSCLFLHDLDVNIDATSQQEDLPQDFAVRVKNEEDLSSNLKLLRLDEFPALGAPTTSATTLPPPPPSSSSVSSINQHTHTMQSTPSVQCNSAPQSSRAPAPSPSPNPSRLSPGPVGGESTGLRTGQSRDRGLEGAGDGAGVGAGVGVGERVRNGGSGEEGSVEGLSVASPLSPLIPDSVFPSSRSLPQGRSRAKCFTRLDAAITTATGGQSGLAFAPPQPPPSMSTATAASGAVDAMSSTDSTTGARAWALGTGPDRLTSFADIGWVSTGEVVGSQYKKARKEASDLARQVARNRFFMAATRAFRRGDGKLAKDLAAKGREANFKMKAKHEEAAMSIFHSRNPPQQVLSRGVIDLHGLHVSEAVSVLSEQLPALTDRGLGVVSVLTGTGHHTKGGNNKARLRPAVERFLSDWGYTFDRAFDKGTGHVGMLKISLQLPPLPTTQGTTTTGSRFASNDGFTDAGFNVGLGAFSAGEGYTGMYYGDFRPAAGAWVGSGVGERGAGEEGEPQAHEEGAVVIR
ncbi:unnamed protein product [Discosporangium mesarthrocarpum]